MIYDNASAHTFKDVMKFAKEGFEEKKTADYIPKNHHPLVANTTFATQPLDCGINKCFKSIYRRKALDWKNK